MAAWQDPGHDRGGVSRDACGRWGGSTWDACLELFVHSSQTVQGVVGSNQRGRCKLVLAM